MTLPPFHYDLRHLITTGPPRRFCPSHHLPPHQRNHPPMPGTFPMTGPAASLAQNLPQSFHIYPQIVRNRLCRRRLTLSLEYTDLQRIQSSRFNPWRIFRGRRSSVNSPYMLSYGLRKEHHSSKHLAGRERSENYPHKITNGTH